MLKPGPIIDFKKEKSGKTLKRKVSVWRRKRKKERNVCLLHLDEEKEKERKMRERSVCLLHPHEEKERKVLAPRW